ncbi:hypothetical protein D3C81_08550 [compost metagenome]
MTISILTDETCKACKVSKDKDYEVIGRTFGLDENSEDYIIINDLGEEVVINFFDAEE